MAFKLDSVVPWGRTMDEYREMFLLAEEDMKKKIAGFGDGPACFNAEATRIGTDVTSYDPIPCEDGMYDIGLSSHFLLMYKALGYDFHIAAMDEMLRACKEIRIFPIVDLDANDFDMIMDVIEYYKGKYDVRIVETGYEFQKDANRLLIIKRV